MYGLIGEKLQHSFSPTIHGFFGDYEYGLFELEKEKLRDFLLREDINGFNVTIPYKKDIMQYLDEIDEKAQKIGAVNTVIKKGGKSYGYNTDYYGLKYLFRKNEVSLYKKKVLILGSGGASASAKALCIDEQADFNVVSRTGEINYENVYELKDTEIIINATPVGMYPIGEGCLIDLTRFSNITFVMDMIYNPSLTELLYTAKKLGIKYANGLSMLVAQAKYSHDLFLGKSFSDDKIDECIKKIRIETDNISLIGMAGMGKTTVGKELSRILKKPFFDTDEEIVKKAKKSIKEIFEEDGEAAFRKTETEVIKELTLKTGVIIATGGGAVTTKRNEYYLKRNGKTVRIIRDEKLIEREGRPLLKDNDTVKKLIKEREPMYKSFSDITVINDKDVKDTAEEILRKIKE